MKRTPKYKIVLNSKSERGKVIIMMMMMMIALSFVHLVCDPGIGFHLILQSLLLSHFTVTLFFFFFFSSSLARKTSLSHGVTMRFSMDITINYYDEWMFLSVHVQDPDESLWKSNFWSALGSLEYLPCWVYNRCWLYFFKYEIQHNF